MLLVFVFTAQQERDKFEYIFSRYKNLMLHKAYGILRDYMLAEDAASEAFIRIYRNLDKIDDPASARTAAFVVTIVKNTALTLLKKEKDHSAEPLEETHGDGYDLETSVLSKVSRERIFALLDEMGEELKGVFLFKYAYDLPHGEIARLLGISENNVTVRLHRARKKLAAKLREEGYANE